MTHEGADAMQASLRDAVTAYGHVANRSGLVGRLASLHGPRRECDRSSFATCEGCDPGDYFNWPCRTAVEIAHHYGIDLTDMHRYRWDTE